jgi:hypothetical protein
MSPPKRTKHSYGREEVTRLVQLERYAIAPFFRADGTVAGGETMVQPKPGVDGCQKAIVAVSLPVASTPPKDHVRPSGVDVVAARSE